MILLAEGDQKGRMRTSVPGPLYTAGLPRRGGKKLQSGMVDTKMRHILDVYQLYVWSPAFDVEGEIDSKAKLHNLMICIRGFSIFEREMNLGSRPLFQHNSKSSDMSICPI